MGAVDEDELLAEEELLKLVVELDIEEVPATKLVLVLQGGVACTEAKKAMKAIACNLAIFGRIEKIG